MNSFKNGTPTLHSEVTGLSLNGFWMLVNDREYFVPFDEYPVFLKATLEEIFAVQQLSPTQLYWESLDCDIELPALEHPEHFPLTYHPTIPRQPRKRSRAKSRTTVAVHQTS
jgi:hypothetical protein